MVSLMLLHVRIATDTFLAIVWVYPASSHPKSCAMLVTVPIMVYEINKWH